MSLKSFHIVFVTFALLLSLFFVTWYFVIGVDVSPMSCLVGWSGVGGLVLTPVYAIYFLKKSRKFLI